MREGIFACVLQGLLIRLQNAARTDFLLVADGEYYILLYLCVSIHWIACPVFPSDICAIGCQVVSDIPHYGACKEEDESGAAVGEKAFFSFP